jgi:hypothetical protein
MSLANDSFQAAPAATGPLIATQLAGGKEIQVVTLAGPDGHLQDSFPTYYYWSGLVAGAASRKHLEIYNATSSGVKLIVRKFFIQSDMQTNTHVAQRWDFDRSSAVGTGGTVITPVFADNTNPAVPAQVTCRAGPTAGATKSGGSIFSFGVNGEETLPAAALSGMINWVPEGPNIQEVTLREGQGCYAMQVTSSTVTIWGVLFVVNII